MELHFSQLILLGVVAAVALGTDLARRKIYNWLTLPAIALGFALQGALGGVHGLEQAAYGFAIAFGLFLVFFLLDAGVGGGDVKLVGAFGAITGPTFVIYTLFYGGLVGVAFALVGLIWKGRVRHAIVNFAGFVRAAVSPGTPATPLRTD
ncbi:MAG: prepilin peptidase, partial [Myxococcales bacterium]|nr:prepilin peptidase [Myxococcales bacterium]